MLLTTLKNRYKIIQQLGEGGFGKTFLTEDIDMPSGRRCVIKQLYPQTLDPQVYQVIKERFQREAAILEHLGDKHSQIPSLYAYFEDEGQFYLVQELIEGVNLTEKVQQEGVLTESFVRNILIGILPVLEYIHSQNIVHRDLKPDNIILRTLNNQPVLIDFGAVKETMETVISTSGNSHSSIVIGTPGYMSSEQNIGRPVYASDLYSLGLTAIYLLTGKIPQEPESNPATGQLMWRQYALNISPTLAAVLDKAIQTYPQDRYSSAREMLNALQNQTTSNNSSPSTTTPTLVISPANFSPTQIQAVDKNKSLSDLQKTIITSSIVGFFLVGALFLSRYIDVSPNLDKSSSTKTAEITPENSSTTPLSNSQSASQNTLPTSTQPVNQNLCQRGQVLCESLLSNPPVEYKNLQYYLATQQWKKADLETSDLIFKGSDSHAYNVSCSRINQIDELWKKNSGGKFGLGVQARIYSQTGNKPGKYVTQTWRLFGDRVGWRVSGVWLESYDELNLSINSPIGHLPVFAGKNSGMRNINAITRAIKCGI